MSAGTTGDGIIFLKGAGVKNFIEILYKLVFVVGVLCVGVGIMSLYTIGGYVEKYSELLRSGQRIQVEVVEKGTSYSGGGSATRHRNDYFKIDYLGEEEQEYTFVYPDSAEFKAYEKGSIISVVYDPENADEAFIVRTENQLEKRKNLPYWIILSGLGMIIVGVLTGKFHKSL
jgi:hypothetical protein